MAVNTDYVQAQEVIYKLRVQVERKSVLYNYIHNYIVCINHVEVTLVAYTYQSHHPLFGCCLWLQGCHFEQLGTIWTMGLTNTPHRTQGIKDARHHQIRLVTPRKNYIYWANHCLHMSRTGSAFACRAYTNTQINVYVLSNQTTSTIRWNSFFQTINCISTVIGALWLLSRATMAKVMQYDAIIMNEQIDMDLSDPFGKGRI